MCCPGSLRFDIVRTRHRQHGWKMLWIEASLRGARTDAPTQSNEKTQPCAFKSLFLPLVAQADNLLWLGIEPRVLDLFNEFGRASLRHILLRALSDLCAPALYERFSAARKTMAARRYRRRRTHGNVSTYANFIESMREHGLRQLFTDKPVLLRLIATVVRQWITTSREFLLRLDTDLDDIRSEITCSTTRSRIKTIEGNLSDPHNGGHTVQIVYFEDGSRLVYKPKDLRVDTAWHALVERLNASSPPFELQAAHAISREGYGWTEYIRHTGCANEDGVKWFFRRAGGWLALFHCFAGSDMHQDNMIAAAEHPVPIDLEMILQASADERISSGPAAQAFEATTEIISNSVIMVGLLPVFGKSPDNKVFGVGGVMPLSTTTTALAWRDTNTDAMRPVEANKVRIDVPNLPHIEGRYAKFGDYVDDFVAGFEDYTKFVLRLNGGMALGGLFEDFHGLSVRKVVRPTRFYYLLLQRLKNHKIMEDGAVWSAQVDFLARLADWRRARSALAIAACRTSRTHTDERPTFCFVERRLRNSGCIRYFGSHRGAPRSAARPTAYTRF